MSENNSFFTKVSTESHQIGGNQKTLLTIDQPKKNTLETVGDKWQLQTQFLTIFIYVRR